MRRVYTSTYAHEAQYVSDILKQEGIGVTLRNLALSGSVGEIPPIEAMPEVWVTNPEDETKARALIALLDTNDPIEFNLESWTCASCNEKHEAQFGSCWNCGTSRPHLGR